MPGVPQRAVFGGSSQRPGRTPVLPSFPTPPTLGGGGAPSGAGMDASQLNQQMMQAGTYGGGATGSVTGGAGSAKPGRGSSSGSAQTIGTGPGVNVNLNTQAPQQLQQSYQDTRSLRGDIKNQEDEFLASVDRAAQAGMGRIMGNAYGTGRAGMDEATQRLGQSGVGAQEYLDSLSSGQRAAAAYSADMSEDARNKLLQSSALQLSALGQQGDLGKTFTGWASDLNNKALQLAGLQSDNYFKNWGLGLQERYGEREADRSDALATWKMQTDPWQMQLQYMNALGGLGGMFG